MTSLLTTEATKDAVWDGFLEAARISRYYSEKSDQYLKLTHLRKAMWVSSAVLATLSFFFQSWEVSLALAGSLLILTVIAEGIWPDQSRLLSSVDADLSCIVNKYDKLFRETNSELIDDAVARYADTFLRESILCTCARVDIPLDKKLAVKAQKYAFEIDAARFDHATG